MEMAEHSQKRAEYRHLSRKARLPKSKLISKEEVKLAKHSSLSKTDRKRVIMNNDAISFEEDEVEQSFNYHSRLFITLQQALFSLKNLGFIPQSAEDFTLIWNKDVPTLIDLANYKQLYAKIKEKGLFRDYHQIFDRISGGKSHLDRNSLVEESLLSGWKEDPDLILQVCGENGLIDFCKFDRILKSMNSLT